MVFPKLRALEALDKGLLRQGRRHSGLIQRGRVLSVDTNYEPPLLSVSVHLRGGQYMDGSDRSDQTVRRTV